MNRMAALLATCHTNVLNCADRRNARSYCRQWRYDRLPPSEEGCRTTFDFEGDVQLTVDKQREQVAGWDKGDALGLAI
jgi:hypothetical protein